MVSGKFINSLYYNKSRNYFFDCKKLKKLNKTPMQWKQNVKDFFKELIFKTSLSFLKNNIKVTARNRNCPFILIVVR